MLAIDLIIFHRKAHVVTMREAVAWSIVWVSLALLFNLYIYYARGSEDAVAFLTGYLIEKSLSVDNLFVFLMIFHYFQTPSTSLHKVLFYGVLGAIVMRGIFIWLGIALVANFHLTLYLFGVFLVFTGIKLGLETEKKMNLNANPIVRIFRYFFPVSETYDDDKFFILSKSGYIATPLFIALLTIESFDLVFALDSVPAILAITYDPFIVYTSNIFAILGLRSLYFVLSHLMGLYHYMHYAISFILVFVGIKMLLTDFVHVNNFIALGVIFAALLISIVFSLIFPEKNSP